MAAVNRAVRRQEATAKIAANGRTLIIQGDNSGRGLEFEVFVQDNGKMVPLVKVNLTNQVILLPHSAKENGFSEYNHTIYDNKYQPAERERYGYAVSYAKADGVPVEDANERG